MSHTGEQDRHGRQPRELAARPWTGRVRDYDLLKELTVGMLVVGVLVLGLAVFVGSPDEPAITLKSWAAANPSDFVATATTELGGTSATATYGPPYSSTPDVSQRLGPLDLAQASGVRIPVNTANDFVLAPLRTLSPAPAAISAWTHATDAQRTAWTTAYGDALAKAPASSPLRVPGGNYGPVPELTGALLAMANGGSLDGVLQAQGRFYSTDPTPAILFLGDGNYFPNLAIADHLTGDQWGMMNETGNYPGQSWLWLFTLLYQIQPIKTFPNADIIVVAIMVVLTLALTLVPFIPGVRAIPRLVPIHRAIWRDYYKQRKQ